MKIKKRKKSGRYRGSQTAKRGRASRTRNAGSRGGVGMSGTGKRGDQKKTLVIKLTGGNNYFGKSKALRKGQARKKLKSINLGQITEKMLNKDKIIDLTGHKILSNGELTFKAKIKASAASSSAQEKIKKSGSELILPEVKEDKKQESKKDSEEN